MPSPEGEPPSGSAPLDELGSLEKLAFLERRVGAQRSALARAPLSMPLPADALSLLALSPTELDGAVLPLSCLPRLAALSRQVEEMIEEVAARQRALAGRVATVRAARRSGPAAHTVDFSG